MRNAARSCNRATFRYKPQSLGTLKFHKRRDAVHCRHDENNYMRSRLEVRLLHKCVRFAHMPVDSSCTTNVTHKEETDLMQCLRIAVCVGGVSTSTYSVVEAPTKKASKRGSSCGARELRNSDVHQAGNGVSRNKGVVKAPVRGACQAPWYIHSKSASLNFRVLFSPPYGT